MKLPLIPALAILATALLLLAAAPGVASAQTFTPSKLQGISLYKPTSLQFGPDGRLYVAQQNGLIYAYTVVRNGPNSYQATKVEVINLINTIKNHNDDGSPAGGVTSRQITGIAVTGTGTNPVLYVGSSDSRIGGGSGGGDEGLDTNSGTISRLSWDGSKWVKVDLVRGLPRSEENHSSNGLQLDEAASVLYVAHGGNTNAGAPSNNFAFMTETALTAAILEIDLTAVEAMPTQYDATNDAYYKYDLPTLDDPSRPNTGPGGRDAGDPFGGNDGLNQAKLVIGGPVRVYASGFRNAYDLVLTSSTSPRRMYTIDNGANGGWGGHPDGEGTAGCTNKYLTGEPGSTGPGPSGDPKVNNLDHLHYVSGPGYYGGHPTPVRGNPNGAGIYTHDGTKGVWRTSKDDPNYPLPADWPPVPPSMANPAECDFRQPGQGDGALYTWPKSTNGLAEYTAPNFGGVMRGDLLTASFDGAIYRIKLNAAGDRATSVTTLFSGFANTPLDVVAQSGDGVFPGTVWAAAYVSHTVTVFEPGDYDGTGSGSCTGSYSTSLDEDGDGYSNADEVDSGTDPCSAGSKPADYDHDLISDLNDPDDDNDGLPDTSDKFALDPDNGTKTQLPISYPLLNGDPGTGFFGLGFTGLMVDGSTDYRQLYDEDNLVAGGATGLFTIDAVTKGDAHKTSNSQRDAFHFGIDVKSSTGPFTVKARLLAPFFNAQAPVNYQSQGLYIGTGDQDNYVKVVLNANGGKGGFEVGVEKAAGFSGTQHSPGGLLSATFIDLFLSVNPAAGTVQPRYSIDGGAVTALGPPVSLSGALLNAVQGAPALAVGLLATSTASNKPFTATWDFVEVVPDPLADKGEWYAVTSSDGSAPDARHEMAYVQAGDKFYVLGGRESTSVDVYDPATGKWTKGAPAPLQMHHFQAVALNGLIYVINAFTGGCCGETPLPNIYIYDPLGNKWITGPEIPQSRRRGSSGAVVYKGKIYLAGGITNGHKSGHVAWLDQYDPATNTWAALPDAPRARDHFHAAVVGDKLYAIGGRTTGKPDLFSGTIAQVDVYDFNTQQWSTLPHNLPTQRAAAAAAVLGEDILVMGGESGAQTTAHAEVEAFNTSKGTWRALSPMLQGRHGTQAIVNNGGVYVVGGSPSRGGGKTNKQEAFYLNEKTTPTGTALTRSTLEAPANAAYGQLTVGGSTSKTISLTNASGNQAIIVTGLAIKDDPNEGGDDAGAFRLNAPHKLPVAIGPGATVQVEVFFEPGSSGAKAALLEVAHSGSGTPAKVALSGSGEGTATTYTLDVDVVGQGSVTKDPDQSSYASGSAVTLSALAAPGWVFRGWGGDAAGTANPLAVTMGASKRITATFESDGVTEAVTAFTLINADTDQDIGPLEDGDVLDLSKLPKNLNVRAGTSPATVGSVSFSLDGSTFRSENVAPYALAGDASGDYWAWTPTPGTHTLTATPYSEKGGGGTVGASLTVSFNVVENAQQYALDLDVVGGGTVTKDPDQSSYPSGSTVKLTATPNKGWVFRGWGGDAAGTANPLAVTMGASKRITATFESDGVTEAVTAFTLINADTDQDIGPLEDGDVLDLSKLPKNLNVRAGTNYATVGSVIFGLDGNPQYRTENVVPYALAGDASGDYWAWTPTPGTHTLTATPYSEKGGGGTVGASLTVSFDVTGGSQAAQSVAVAGVSAKVSAGPANALSLDGAEQKAEAQGRVEGYALDLQLVGEGTVEKHPDKAFYPPGSTVTLIAKAKSGWNFRSWNGTVVRTGNSKKEEKVQVKMTSNRSVRATFGSTTAIMAATPEAVDFSSVELGETSKARITLTNESSQNLVISALNSGGDPSFAISKAPDLPVVLRASGGAIEVEVAFTAASTGAEWGVLEVRHNGAETPLTVPLRSQGSVPSSPTAAVLYRVSAGGAGLAAPDGGPAWSADEAEAPSPWVNISGKESNETRSVTETITLSASVPAGVPMALFQSERLDPPAPPQMQWSFPVSTDGQYEVRLYFADIQGHPGKGKSKGKGKKKDDGGGKGKRTFDVVIEGQKVLSDYDIFSDAGGNHVGVMRSFVMDVGDGEITIDFLRKKDRPGVSGIEILAVSQSASALAARAAASDALTAGKGGLAAAAEVPSVFALHGNYPNPFNPTTTIVFDLPENAAVEIDVFDLLGRRVLGLPVQEMPAGAKRELLLNASSLASGVYLYQVKVQAGTNVIAETGRLVLLK